MSARIPARAPLAPVAPRGDSLLDAIEYRFRLRGEGPQPLSVDGRRLGQPAPRIYS